MQFLINTNICQTDIWRAKEEKRNFVSKDNQIEGLFFISDEADI